MTCVYPCPIKSDMFELSQHAASEASYTHNQSLVRDLSSKWTEDLPVKTEQTAAHFIRKKASWDGRYTPVSHFVQNRGKEDILRSKV